MLTLRDVFDLGEALGRLEETVLVALLSETCAAARVIFAPPPYLQAMVLEVQPPDRACCMPHGAARRLHLPKPRPAGIFRQERTGAPPARASAVGPPGIKT